MYTAPCSVECSEWARVVLVTLLSMGSDCGAHRAVHSCCRLCVSPARMACSQQAQLSVKEPHRGPAVVARLPPESGDAAR